MSDEVKAIEAFAGRFVRTYWETIKSGDFPMPPNEPVEEPLDLLLSRISHATEFGRDSDHPRLCKIRMKDTFGDWWIFSFRKSTNGWELIACLAGSSRGSQHDLLGPIYADYFEPFLRRVTDVANS